MKHQDEICSNCPEKIEIQYDSITTNSVDTVHTAPPPADTVKIITTVEKIVNKPIYYKDDNLEIELIMFNDSLKFLVVYLQDSIVQINTETKTLVNKESTSVIKEKSKLSESKWEWWVCGAGIFWWISCFIYLKYIKQK